MKIRLGAFNNIPPLNQACHMKSENAKVQNECERICLIKSLVNQDILVLYRATQITKRIITGYNF